jgi:hypothetical protein
MKHFAIWPHFEAHSIDVRALIFKKIEISDTLLFFYIEYWLCFIIADEV